MKILVAAPGKLHTVRMNRFVPIHDERVITYATRIPGRALEQRHALRTVLCGAGKIASSTCARARA